ncbi:tyrosine-type recombinase/integrase [Streptomyces antarcticus]|uniref:tyrosine-type recombinase/integrase n=1 Tax=Streptomyces antarcticus TaxID=2996458 RepID=UPI002271928F|nr:MULTISPECIES: tyrosine-type recombinase/integrase [unclassified Streptomyces]MCY0943645.1 tyrosine-type recombinase/integrase [Streptomyces sp. H34-AA3]MCZ4080544.1 tyrosine-type recombinase/integrase [Streptomyces sp. H34-S5]
MDSSFDVRIYTIETNQRAKGASYTVRWKVGTKKHSKTYSGKALADAGRSELMAAHKKGAPFSVATGLPISFASKAADTNWYDFAVEYVDWKWPNASGNNRKIIAKAMTAATVALLRTPPKQFAAVEVRTALREWAFNTKRRSEAPDGVREILDWVQRNTQSMAAWEDTEKVEAVVAALGQRLDGTAAAASTITRNSRIFNLVMGYAIKHGILLTNPLPKGKGAGSAPKVAQAIDKRALLNPTQVAQLFAWIGARPRRGRVYRAFFATMYYAGLRPEEIVALRVIDATLPDRGWGEFLVHQAQPEVGSQWTDTGKVHEERELKGRAEGDTRPVPIHPSLVALLRDVIARYKLQPESYLLPGEGGEMLAGSVFRRVWAKARKEVLSTHEHKSPVGKRVYDLRHTCLTTWLNNGIPQAQVAEWAGNSVPVLVAIYARCIVGQRDDLLERIEDAHNLPEVAG